ncbi:AlpA family phage regulatory protein [Bradyrhizobium sp. 195]|nr:AlpA family phage regulatory protein [Bradyrhizobium sp. 195]
MKTTTTAGLRRLATIIKPNGPIPVGKSTWWAGVKSGRFPAPVKLGPRITAWRDSDIQQLIQEGIPRVAIAPGNGDAS